MTKSLIAAAMVLFCFIVFVAVDAWIVPINIERCLISLTLYYAILWRLEQ